MKRIVPFLMALALALPAWAHEGEDHGAPAAPTSAAPEIASRAASATETFGMVAVIRDTGLILYLDRLATNEPVAGAQIEVESGALRTNAKFVEPGVYWIETGHFARPGKYPMTIAVQTDDVADLMAITLEVSAPLADAAAPSGKSASWNSTAVWGTSGALLLAGVGIVAVNRRGRKAGEEVSAQ